MRITGHEPWSPAEIVRQLEQGHVSDGQLRQLVTVLARRVAELMATLEAEDVCPACGGDGRISVPDRPNGGPPMVYGGTMPCPACDGEGK
jgi:hypothetical protein